MKKFFKKIADWSEGKRTLLVAAFGGLINLAVLLHWIKIPIEGATAANLVVVTASAWFRLIANDPGPLSQAAKLPEAEELKTAVRESQAVDIVSLR